MRRSFFIAMTLACSCTSGSTSFEDRGPVSEVREAARRQDEDTTTAALRGSSDEGWKKAEAGYGWSFPSDHWGHAGYKTEWWYFTGHLADAKTDEPRFAYQVTFFKVGLAPEAADYDSNWSTDSLVMGHVAVSDLVTEQHVFSESIQRVAPGLAGIGTEPEPTLIWVKAPPGSPGRWSLEWTGDGFHMAARDARAGYALELTAEPGKPLIFQGPGGLSRKGETEAQASLYYSFTRLETRGVVERHGERVEVRGQSWMDKEIGSSMLSESQVGWDWFSLQLDDGKELMLYVLRNPEGGVNHASGTRVFPDARVEYFDESGWQLEVLERWTSPRGGRYPVAWRLQVGDRDLELRAAFPDQENRGTLIDDLAYWEGAVLIREDGDPAGRGFVEMTGY